jgi:RNA polymerase sigma-B factor
MASVSRPALARLTPQLRRIVTLRFYGNQTQSQIAAQLGISRCTCPGCRPGPLAVLHKDLDARA